MKKPRLKRPKEPFVPNTKRTASIPVEAGAALFSDLVDTRFAYAAACNLLLPVVVESRCWNRVDLHNNTYGRLRSGTPLGSQMCCHVFRTACGAGLSMRSNGEIEDGDPAPTVSFCNAPVHYDTRAYRIRGENLSLWTLADRPEVTSKPAAHHKCSSEQPDRRCKPPQRSKLADVIYVSP